jgi:MFS family permease
MAENSSGGTRRWWIMALFFSCYVILYMDRSCMSMAAPHMVAAFGWNSADYGYVATAFFIGYAASQIPGGWLADKFGGVRVVIFGAIWWSVFVFLTPYGHNFGLMILIRALMGFGEGVTLPAISSMIARWMPKNESGIGQGISLAGVPAGIALAMPITGWIMNTWGWEMVFYSFAFIAPLWVAVWKLWGSDDPRHDKWITKKELAYIAKGQVDPHTGLEDTTTPRDAFSTPAVWIGALSFYCTNYLFYLFVTWLPMYFVKGRGLDISSSAIYTMMPYLAAMITYPLGGWLADRAGEKFGHNWGRRLYPIIGQIGAAGLLALSLNTNDVWPAVLLISGANGLLCLTMGGYYSMIIIFTKKNAGKITGLWATFATMGGITAPTFTGLLVQNYSYNAGLYLGAGIAVVGAVLVLFCTVKPVVHRDQARTELQQAEG